MKIKNREAIGLYEFLAAMQSGDVSLSIEDWKTLSDNRGVLEGVLVDVNESRNKIIRKYSSDDKNNEIAAVDEDKREEFSDEYMKMLEEEIDIELKTVAISNLGDTMGGKKGIWEFMKFMVIK